MTTHTMPSVIGGNTSCLVKFDWCKSCAPWANITTIEVQGEDFDINDLSYSALQRLTAECEEYVSGKDG